MNKLERVTISKYDCLCTPKFAMNSWRIARIYRLVKEKKDYILWFCMVIPSWKSTICWTKSQNTWIREGIFNFHVTGWAPHKFNICLPNFTSSFIREWISSLQTSPHAARAPVWFVSRSLFAVVVVASVRVPLTPLRSSWPRSNGFTGFHAGAVRLLYCCDFENATQIICSCFPLQVFKDLRSTSCQISEANHKRWNWNSSAARGQRTNEPEPWMDAAALIGAQQPQRTRPSASLWMDRNQFQVEDR